VFFSKDVLWQHYLHSCWQIFLHCCLSLFQPQWCVAKCRQSGAASGISWTMEPSCLVDERFRQPTQSVHPSGQMGAWSHQHCSKNTHTLPGDLRGFFARLEADPPLGQAATAQQQECRSMCIVILALRHRRCTSSRSFEQVAAACKAGAGVQLQQLTRETAVPGPPGASGGWQAVC